jgi:predicted amidohydrolase YtcJ
MDGHSVLANSAALKLSNIDKNGPPSPAGGVIDRDADGEPTGILRERASGLVNPPASSAEDTYRGFKAAVKNANSFGVTASSDIASPLRIASYRRYFAEKNPTFRIGFYSRTDSWPLAFQALAQVKPIAGWFQPNGVKAYMDGSLGSRTAYMHEPFTKPLPQQPADWRGLPMPGAVDGTYATRFQEAASRGLQVIVHAIGDQANHDVLDLFSQVPNVQNRRFRIEHVQHLLPSDYESFAKFGVIPSMQPYHKADDGRYCEDVIGTARSRSSYAFKSLLGHQAKLAFGSDWPVVTINPWEGIKTAVTGRILTGKIWMPEQNISLDEALDSYTRRGAYAMKMESVIGSLTAGHRADFAILNLDPFKQGIDLAKVRPISLYVEGRKVY